MTIARVAAAAERLLDRVRWRDPHPEPVIEPYIGYSTPDGVVVRGRVLSARQRNETKRPPSLFGNVKARIRAFATDEIGDVLVAAGGTTTRSDEEGYFRLEVGRDIVRDGAVSIRLPDFDIEVSAAAMVTPHTAEYGIISDIDDTIMRTEAWAIYRNIWNTITKSAAERHVFPDSLALIARLHDGRNPVFYVSSSPWNLHGFLSDVFKRNGLVFGPKFLRDLGISETKFIKGSHGEHKGAAIDTILAANPHLPFVLIGDTGQHDAAVYRQAIERHPDRIAEVILRVAGMLDDRDAADAEAIRKTGVTCHMLEDFRSLV